MNSESIPVRTAARAQPRPARRRRSTVVGLVAVVSLGLAACTSEPSPRRIAEDLVNALTEPGAQRDCLLEKLDAYSNDQLKEITASADDPGPGTALQLFEADLAACG